MKRQIIYLLKIAGFLSSMVFLIISCEDDFLEKPAGADITIDTVFATPSNAQQLIFSLYHDDYFGADNIALSWWDAPQWYSSWSEIGEELYIGEGAGQGTSRFYGRGTFNTSTSHMYPLDYLFLAVRTANTFIEKAPEIITNSSEDEEYVRRMLGEAHAHLAYQYFKGIRVWGSLPWINKRLEGGEEPIPRASFNDIIDSMIVRLDIAAELLPAQWEDRWIRDMGFDKFIPEAVGGLCEKCGVKVSDFAKIIYPCYYGGARKKLNKRLEFEPDKVMDNLQANVGDTGVAQPLVMLSKALQESKAGDKLLVISYGSGCDALYFEVTENIKKLAPRVGINGYLAKRAELDSYTKYLAWRRMIPLETGLRNEEDHWTRWSLVWRMDKLILGLQGSKCKKCGTQQFPAQRVCVNPNCLAIDEMETVYLSGNGGKIFSYTSDMLAASINPPAMYGAVDINGGGRFVFDYTDCVLDDLQVGKPIDFSFRIKFYDEKRDITNYFWKAVPDAGEVG